MQFRYQMELLVTAPLEKIREYLTNPFRPTTQLYTLFFYDHQKAGGRGLFLNHESFFRERAYTQIMRNEPDHFVLYRKQGASYYEENFQLEQKGDQVQIQATLVWKKESWFSQLAWVIGSFWLSHQMRSYLERMALQMEEYAVNAMQVQKKYDYQVLRMTEPDLSKLFALQMVGISLHWQMLLAILATCFGAIWALDHDNYGWFFTFATLAMVLVTRYLDRLWIYRLLDLYWLLLIGLTIKWLFYS
ncbi:hypothetical protein [Baia soyae]|uniref:Uncharacterized protein n=1 Tax=Baia soyae TaxID=1544746 RepID=A0A4R2RJT9_9BACL|nr:hypothetical protein [Baia soyae]TCP64132.1 hypothetical protein EDD57_14317 [Baia soyae]